MDDKGVLKPVQPNENNGGAPAPINKSTHNNTKPFPNTKAKSENAWTGYGVKGKL